MYDIKPLEEEWNKYRTKKRRPIYIFVLILFIIIGILMYMNDNIFLQTKKPYVKNNVDKNDILSDSTSVAVSEYNLSKNNFITKSKNVDKKEHSPIPSIVENIPILDEVKEDKYKEVKNEKPHKRVQLNIIESSSLDAYKDVEKRFYESRDIDDSIFLAKSYYRKGLYKKSEYWALQTNKLNNNIDESWIIFAQSKMKQGHKNEAVRILTNYVKRTGSQNALNILNRLKNN